MERLKKQQIWLLGVGIVTTIGLAGCAKDEADEPGPPSNAKPPTDIRAPKYIPGQPNIDPRPQPTPTLGRPDFRK